MIDKNDPTTYVICPICNQKFGNLYQHAIRIHGYEDLDTFKTEFGMEYLVSEAVRNKWSISTTARNYAQGGHSDATKEKMSKVKLGKYLGVVGKYERTAEIREKISKSVAQKHKEGAYRLEVAGIKGYFYSKKMKRECYYNSTWEKRLLECFDKWSRINWFEYEPLELSYWFMGAKHIYIPDFLVMYDDGIKSIWEVKRQDHIDYDFQTEEKLCALKEWCAKNHHNMFVISIKDIEGLERYLKTCPKEELNEYYE
jgi:hypothetical protein